MPCNPAPCVSSVQTPACTSHVSLVSVQPNDSDDKVQSDLDNVIMLPILQAEQEAEQALVPLDIGSFATPELARILPDQILRLLKYAW